MEVILIVLTILIFIITINLFINVSVNYDIVKNLGRIKIKLFFFTILDAEVSLIAGYFNFFRKNKKVIQIKIDLNDKNFKFIEYAGKFFLEKITLTDCYSEITLGLGDPSLSSIACGYVTIINGLIKSYIYNTFDDVKVKNNVNVDFFNYSSEFRLNIQLFITIFDFVWSFIKAGIKRSLYGKKRKFARNS